MRLRSGSKGRGSNAGGWASRNQSSARNRLKASALVGSYCSTTSVNPRETLMRTPKLICVKRPDRSRSTPRNKVLARLVLIALLAGSSGQAAAQNMSSDGGAAARAGAIAHAQKMRKLFPDIDAGAQVAPAMIPEFEIDPDPGGAIATFQPNGATITAKNGFFQNLGTNGRTCFTCHQPQDGWSLSAQHARDRFDADSDDPLFRLVDGATCPSDDVSTHQAKRTAYNLLLAKGLIRIG